MTDSLPPIDCACLIHSNGYDWSYVEHLYRMIQANTSREFRFHVYTESSRPVPAHMIKHALVDWPGVGGPKKSWWYKMQLFNKEYHQGPMLYFDLDVVISRNIDWMFDRDMSVFWTLHDFRYLWKPYWTGMNSSVMYWDTLRWDHVWQDFKELDLKKIFKKYHGDQDYLNVVIKDPNRRFLDPEKIKSWRWQIKDGGIDVRTRTYKRPDAGSVLDPKTSIMIFHGNPKPHQIHDPVIKKYWHSLS